MEWTSWFHGQFRLGKGGGDSLCWRELGELV